MFDYEVCPTCGAVLRQQLAHEHTCEHLLQDHDLSGDHDLDPEVYTDAINGPQVKYCEQCERFHFRFDMITDDLCDECAFELAGLLPLDEQSRFAIKGRLKDWLIGFDWADEEPLTKFYLELLGDFREMENTDQSVDLAVLRRFEVKMIVPRTSSESSLLEVVLSGESNIESRSVAKFQDSLFMSWAEDIDLKEANTHLQKMNFNDREIVLRYVFHGESKLELARSLDTTIQAVETVLKKFSAQIKVALD